jgi:putative transposase
LGIRKDKSGIVDTDFVLNQFSKDSIIAKKLYREFMCRNNENENVDVEFRHERAEYRSERKILVRNRKASEVIDFVASYTKQDKGTINIKYIKKTMEFKSLSALLLRGVCDMKQKDICKEIGNITQAHAAKLCLKGVKLINEKNEYKNIIRDFIEQKVS